MYRPSCDRSALNSKDDVFTRARPVDGGCPGFGIGNIATSNTVGPSWCPITAAPSRVIVVPNCPLPLSVTGCAVPLPSAVCEYRANRPERFDVNTRRLLSIQTGLVSTLAP